MKIKLRFITAALCAVLCATSMLGLGAAAAGVPADMPDGWSHDAVAWALENGLIIGDADGSVRPGDPIKRSELAAIMNRAFGKGPESDLSGFTDVPPEAWYHGDMASAFGTGWILGDGAGHLMPEKHMTREQFFTVMARALGLPDGDGTALDGFRDGTEVSAWAAGPVSAMLNAGYVQGSGGYLRPSSPISREEVCQVFYNVFGTIIRTPGVYEGLSGSVLVSCGGVTIRNSSLTSLCAGCIGDGEKIILLDSECGTLLGNKDSVITETTRPGEEDADGIPEEPEDWEEEDEEEPEPEPDPAEILAAALRHFAENGNNVRAERTESGTYEDRPLGKTTSNVILDGSLEAIILPGAGGSSSEFMVDHEAGICAYRVGGDYWANEDINGSITSFTIRNNSIYGLSLGLDAGWFEETESGVYSVLPDHLEEAVDTVRAMAGSASRFTSFTLYVSDGALSGLSYGYVNETQYYTMSYLIEFRFSGYGENSLEFPDLLEETSTMMIYSDPETYVGTGTYVIYDVNVLYAGGGIAYLTDDSGTFFVMPLRGSEELLAGITAGSVYDLITKVSETGDTLFPYALDCVTAISSTASYAGFEACDNLGYMEYAAGYGPAGADLLGITFSMGSDGIWTVTDQNGDSGTFLMDRATDELSAEIAGSQGKVINVGSLLFAEDGGGGIVIVPLPVSSVIRYPAVCPESMTVPLGTDVETLYDSISIADAYTGETIVAPGDPLFFFMPDEYDPDTPGVYEIYVFYDDEYCGTVNVRISVPTRYDPDQTAGFGRLAGLDPESFSLPALKSHGDVRIPVIPVAFKDSGYTNPHGDGFGEFLDTCFNDTTGKTGWYSLREYYETVSYGDFRIHADIFETYTCGYTIEEVLGMSDISEIVESVLTYYDDFIDYSLYDNDGDGDIDCPYLIFLAPIDACDFTSTLWCYNSFMSRTASFEDGTLRGWQYVWFGADFLDVNYLGSMEDDPYAFCGTLAHETGHALGLEDYYWTSKSLNLVASTEMMDCCVGSLTAYSRMLLGWADPLILHFCEGNGLQLRPLESTGDVIMIAKDPDPDIYGESFMISLYTPDGPNGIVTDYAGLFSVPGIVIYHINNELPENAAYSSSYSIPGEEFDGKVHIKLYRNATEHYDAYNSAATDSDLFQTGDSVVLYWDDGSVAAVLTVNSADGTGASVSVATGN